MDDEEKMNLAKRQCQRIYPKILKLEELLEKLKGKHKHWADIYEGIQLKRAHVEKIIAKVSAKRMSPSTLEKEFLALDEKHRKLLIDALEGSLEV